MGDAGEVPTELLPQGWNAIGKLEPRETLRQHREYVIPIFNWFAAYFDQESDGARADQRREHARVRLRRFNAQSVRYSRT